MVKVVVGYLIHENAWIITKGKEELFRTHDALAIDRWLEDREDQYIEV